MTCRRCNAEKAASEMASKGGGRLRNWCKACDATRRRLEYGGKRQVMHDRVLEVSAALGRQLAEAPL